MSVEGLRREMNARFEAIDSKFEAIIMRKWGLVKQ